MLGIWVFLMFIALCVTIPYGLCRLGIIIYQTIRDNRRDEQLAEQKRAEAKRIEAYLEKLFKEKHSDAEEDYSS